MGRLLAIMGIWAAGFALGFIGYLSYPAISSVAVSILPSLMSFDTQMSGALMAGVATSVVTVLAVSIWAYASKPNNAL